MVDVDAQDKPAFEVFAREFQTILKSWNLPQEDIVAVWIERENYDLLKHGLDSLDFLDVNFILEKNLNVRISAEELLNEKSDVTNPGLTLGDLYKHTRYDQVAA